MKKVLIFIVMLLMPLSVYANDYKVTNHIIDTEVEIAGAIKVKELIVVEGKIDYLNSYGENLTNKTYITNPAIAREDEIKKLIVILLTPDKSALLIGKPGIGKTAIVEGLAYKIQNNDVPDVLRGYQIFKIASSVLSSKIKVGDVPNILKRKRIFSVDLAKIVAGTKFRGDFENKMSDNKIKKYSDILPKNFSK